MFLDVLIVILKIAKILGYFAIYFLVGLYQTKQMEKDELSSFGKFLIDYCPALKKTEEKCSRRQLLAGIYFWWFFSAWILIFTIVATINYSLQFISKKTITFQKKLHLLKIFNEKLIAYVTFKPEIINEEKCECKNL